MPENAVAPYGKGTLWDFSQLEQAATGLIERFGAFGYEVTAQSRLRKYERVFRQLNSDKTGSRWVHFRQGEMYHAAVATRELSQFQRVADVLLPRRSAWDVKLREALTGAKALPEHDRQPLARSAQFELVLAATLIQQGFRVKPAHADLEVGICKLPVPIAVKRITSQNKLAARLKEASDQIAQSGRVGIVAIEVTQLLYTPGAAIDAADEKIGSYVAQCRLESWLRDHEAVFQACLHKTWVAGAIAAHSPLMFNSLARYNCVLSEAYPIAVWDECDARVPLLKSLGKALNGNY